MIVVPVCIRKALVVQPVNEQFEDSWALVFERKGLVACFFESSRECGTEEPRVVR
jgi:hypothetical protein